MKVLVAVDESEIAERAFHWYLENLHQPSYELLVVHVGEQPQLPSMYITENNPQSKASEIVRLLTQSDERMQVLKDKYDVKCQDLTACHRSFFQRTERFAGERITTIASQESCDIIVLGSRGLGRVRRTILGSVSNYVVHHTKIPVLVCPGC